MEKPINQRIKFLLEELKLSARDFSRAVGVADNNTQNYLEPRFAQPKADYLEKVMLHFESINPIWLLTGKGEPFLVSEPASTQSLTTRIKNNRGQIGQVIGTNQGTATNSSQSLTDCEKVRDSYKAERDIARAELAGLRQQLEMAQALIASKDETISLLRGGYNRPN